MTNNQPNVDQPMSLCPTQDEVHPPVSTSPPSSLHYSKFDSRETNLTREPWKQSHFHHVFTSNLTILFVFMLVSSVILTIFARSGELVFNDQPISWKIILYNIVLEAMYLVVVTDLLALVIDYFLTTAGLNIQQMGHAIAKTTQLSFGAGHFSYSTCFHVITVGFALVPPVLLSIVLLRSSGDDPYTVPAANRLVLTNALGGRSGDNFGMTGHLFLFTSTREKFVFNQTRQQYVYYQRFGTTRNVFIPKTPQVGTYADDVNSQEGSDIVQARVIGVQGLLYQCRPTVREDSRAIEDYESINPALRGEFFKLLKRKMAPRKADDNTKATLNLTIAIKKGPKSTAVLTIPCSVTAAEGDLDISKEEDGFMSMSVVNDNLNELSLKLPGRVLGTIPSLLDIAVENAISALGINVVDDFIALDKRIEEWDGLIRCLVGAFGIRSAIHDTFADREDKRLATNVMVMGPKKRQPENLRIIIIWIPFIITLVTRILTLLFPSVLTEGLSQILEWMSPYRAEFEAGLADSGKKSKNRKFFLSLDNASGQWLLRFRGKRDPNLRIGSRTRIRKVIAEKSEQVDEEAA